MAEDEGAELSLVEESPRNVWGFHGVGGRERLLIGDAGRLRYEGNVLVVVVDTRRLRRGIIEHGHSVSRLMMAWPRSKKGERTTAPINFAFREIIIQ